MADFPTLEKVMREPKTREVKARLAPTLHMRLRIYAAERGYSVNQALLVLLHGGLTTAE